MPDSEIDVVIDALGGTSVVAGTLDIALPRVSNWRARGKIPNEMWPELVALADARGVKGITLEALAAMHARRPAEIDDAAEARP